MLVGFCAPPVSQRLVLRRTPLGLNPSNDEVPQMHPTLQASLRAALRSHRDIESIGPFLAAFDADDDSPFRNYAVPDESAQPTPEEVEDLRCAFVRRGRLPRLEFLPAAAPAAEAALLQAGFVTQARLPIMTCAAAQLRELAAPPGITLDMAVGSDELRQAAAVQNAAYGAPEPTTADVARLQRIVDAGGLVGLAQTVGWWRRGVRVDRRCERGHCRARRRRCPARLASTRDRHCAGHQPQPQGVRPRRAGPDAHGVRDRAGHLRSRGLHRHLGDHVHLPAHVRELRSGPPFPAQSPHATAAQ